MKHISILLIALSFVLSGAAQSNNLRISKPQPVTPAPTYPAKSTSKTHKAEKVTQEDTVYACDSYKQHGWFYPSKILKKKDISKVYCVLRFTNKNKAGKWCKIEYLNAYGKPITGRFQPYIVKLTSETDTIIDTKWREKLETACCIEMISDATGEKVVQERSYDADGKLIFSFSATPIGNNQYIGSYKDSWGLPAEMRQNKGYSYGTLVVITRDKWGNDSVLQYIDSKGWAKPNSDGAYKEVFVCDKNGNKLKNQSYDANNNLIIDNCGNCGYEYQYDGNGDYSASICMDDKWQPMKMKNKGNVLKSLYTFDSYHRLTSESFVDINDKPTPNDFGTCSENYILDDHGNIIENYGLDANGNLSPINNDGIAKFCSKFDSLGNKIEFHAFGPDGKYISNGDSYSSMYYTYTNGKLTESRCYLYNKDTGIESLCYEYTDNGKTNKISYYDGSKTITERNDDGNDISSISYNSDGQITEQSYYKYNIDAKSLGFDDNEYFKDGINTTCKINEKGDTTYISYSNAIGDFIINRYFSQNISTSYFAHKRYNDRKVSELHINKYGAFCRTNNNNVITYNADVQYTFKYNINSIAGKDEFGEPDYIYSSGDPYYYVLYTSLVNAIYKDENDNDITDFDSFKDSCPKAYGIEVTDSVAYRAGLSDNDIILSINDINVDRYSGGVFFETTKDVLDILNTSSSKTMLIYHLDKSTLKSSIKRVNLGVGSANDLGFKVVRTFKTQRQINRIDSTIMANNITLPTGLKDQTGHDKLIILAQPRVGEQAIGSQYSMAVGKSSLIVGAQILEYPDVKWILGDTESKFKKLYRFKSENYKIDSLTLRLWYTTDAKAVKYFDVSDFYPNCSITYYYTSDDIYSRVKSIADNSQISFASEMNYSAKDLKAMSEDELNELYDKAGLYYFSDFDDTSFPIYQKLYNAGYKRAACNLAKCYIDGYGTDINPKLAKKYALEAEEYNGNKVPLLKYAKYCANNGNIKEATKYAQQVASTSIWYDRAQVILGDIAHNNSDSIAACDYYMSAVKECYSLNESEATELVHKINELPNSTDNIQQTYYIAVNKINAENNNEENAGLYLLKGLVKNNIAAAGSNLAIYYLNCDNQFGIDKAIEYAQYAYDNGYSLGMIHVGQYYLNKNEYQQALNYFKKCTDSGSTTFYGNYYCGKIYSDKNYFGYNPSIAVDYYTEALLASNIYGKYKGELDETIEYLRDNLANNIAAAKGLFFAAWEYYDNNEYEKAFELIKIASDRDPSLIDIYPDFGRIWYDCYFKLNMENSDEFTEFIDSVAAAISVPSNIDENSPLAELAGSSSYIYMLNDWDCTQASSKTNILDKINSDGCDIVVKCNGEIKLLKNVKIPYSYLRIWKADKTTKLDIIDAYIKWSNANK